MTPPPNDSGKYNPVPARARQPVWMPPQSIFSSIPDQFHRDVFDNKALRSQHKRVFDAGNGEYHSYDCLQTIDTALALLGTTNSFPDPKRIRKTKDLNGKKQKQ